MPRVVIFANGQIPHFELASQLLRPDDFLLAADGGARHIMSLGLMPNLVIGDMDSLTEDDLYELGNNDVKTLQYPEDKDETDLELALLYAAELQPTSILIVAALGDRLDQTIGNISLLTDIQFSTLDIRLDDGVDEVFFCRNQVEVKGRSGDVVSLIPWGGDVAGVTTNGLQWPLLGETLFSYKTRGVSNQMISDAASIKIQSGLLLVTHHRS